jgi:hypothetical protein
VTFGNFNLQFSQLSVSVSHTSKLLQSKRDNNRSSNQPIGLISFQFQLLCQKYYYMGSVGNLIFTTFLGFSLQSNLLVICKEYLLNYSTFSKISRLRLTLLQCGQIFSGFRELSFLHTFSNVPMNESSLGVEQIEFRVQSRPTVQSTTC